MAHNTNDRRAVQNARTREKEQRAQELEDVRFLMESPAGRRLAARILELTGCERLTPFTPNAMSLANDLGVQRTGFWLLGEIRAACPQLELVMRQETLKAAERAAMREEADEHEHDDD